MHTTALAKARKVVVASITASFVSLPLALASTSSAEAATTRNGCTVAPLTPARVGSSKFIQFPIRVTCVQNRIVEITQQRYRVDPSPKPDHFLGTKNHIMTFTGAGTTILASSIPLPNIDADKKVLLHYVNFRVASINGVTRFGRYEKSPVRSFTN